MTSSSVFNGYRTRWGLIAVALTVTVLSLTALTSAQADSYDYQDPVRAGCSVGAYTVASSNIVAASGRVIGRVELRKGPNCNAYWARTTSYYGATLLYANVARRASNGYGNIAQFRMSSTHIYGNMLTPIWGMCLRGEGYAFGYGTSTRSVCWA
jgi:hypothetical protein